MPSLTSGYFWLISVRFHPELVIDGWRTDSVDYICFSSATLNDISLNERRKRKRLAMSHGDSWNIKEWFHSPNIFLRTNRKQFWSHACLSMLHEPHSSRLLQNSFLEHKPYSKWHWTNVESILVVDSPSIRNSLIALFSFKASQNALNSSPLNAKPVHMHLFYEEISHW